MPLLLISLKTPTQNSLFYLMWCYKVYCKLYYAIQLHALAIEQNVHVNRLWYKGWRLCCNTVGFTVWQISNQHEHKAKKDKSWRSSTRLREKSTFPQETEIQHLWTLLSHSPLSDPRVNHCSGCTRLSTKPKAEGSLSLLYTLLNTVVPQCRVEDCIGDINLFCCLQERWKDLW